MLRCAVLTLADFCTWLNVRVTTGRDPAILLWVMVSVLFPSRFTIVRVVPAGDLVTVLVMEPAGFVTVRVIGAPPDGLMNELGPMALPIPPPPPLPRSAAKGKQTNKPSATIGRILLRICRPPFR